MLDAFDAAFRPRQSQRRTRSGHDSTLDGVLKFTSVPGHECEGRRILLRLAKRDYFFSGGYLVGPGDFGAQVVQVFENLNARLEEGGATFKDVVKLNYYLTDASDLKTLRDTRNRYLDVEQPPASTLVVVKQLFREEFLVEVEAVAVD
jgi:2-iminobutanoate/2-iminopropanoate deaminase